MSTSGPASAHDTSENQICQKLNTENTFLAVILTRILESVCTRQTNQSIKHRGKKKSGPCNLGDSRFSGSCRVRLDVVDLLVAQYPGTAPTRILLVGTSSTCTTAVPSKVDLGTCSTVLLL